MSRKSPKTAKNGQKKGQTLTKISRGNDVLIASNSFLPMSKWSVRVLNGTEFDKTGKQAITKTNYTPAGRNWGKPPFLN